MTASPLSDELARRRETSFRAKSLKVDTTVDSDIGTCAIEVSLHSLLACAVNPSVRVVATELYPAVQLQLGRNIVVNQFSERYNRLLMFFPMHAAPRSIPPRRTTPQQR
jgi:hypothetical protein